jgi:hypothetical protein
MVIIDCFLLFPLRNRRVYINKFDLDTTSSVLSWAMTFLSRDSRIVHRIREELQSVAGEKPLEYSDVKKLNYCNMVIRETLRMRPPVHTLDRQAIYDCEFAGQKIPAGVSCFSLLTLEECKLLILVKDLCVSFVNCCSL